MRALPIIPLIPTTLAAAMPHPPEVRHLPDADAIEIPPGVTLLHFAPETPGGPGDTHAQSRAALGAIAERLALLGLGFGDLVRLQVALAPDPQHADTADRAGFEAAWHEAQGQPAPAHAVLSILQVTGLGARDQLVTIEATAARPVLQAPAVGH